MKITVLEGTKRYEVPFSEGSTILAALQTAGVQSITAPCGGNGTCRKCSVNVQSSSFSGTCLACITKAEDGMTVEIAPEERMSFADSSGGKVYGPDPGQSGYAAAFDIGTTTVICQLLDLATGNTLTKFRGSNEQRIFGGDVLSRLKAAEEGHAEELHEKLAAQTDQYLDKLCRTAKVDKKDVRLLAVTGNTIMMHFFAGLDPAQISTAPFTPVSLFGDTVNGKDIGLDFDGSVYICPAVSGFIGSDVVCGILSSGVSAAEGQTMLLDLGANTEMVIGNKDGMLACAADGGAAFKASLLEHGMMASTGAIAGVKYEDGELKLEVLGGGKPKGICGSGLIDVLGIMLREGVLDEMGHIAEADEVGPEMARFIGEEEGRTVFYLTEDKKIFISQADISKFQMAKAAIYAGVCVLSEEAGVSPAELDRLLLGGGFGAFAHRSSSAVLGIIPSECKGKTIKMGNVALAGAVSAALSGEARAELSRIQKIVKVTDLPTHPSFSDAFTDGMFFE